MGLDLLVAFGLEQSVEALHHRTNSTNGVADSRRSTCDFQFRAYNNGRGCGTMMMSSEFSTISCKFSTMIWNSSKKTDENAAQAATRIRAAVVEGSGANSGPSTAVHCSTSPRKSRARRVPDSSHNVYLGMRRSISW
jgi:hypothetical protein